MPETAWAVRTLKRWRRVWVGLYLGLSFAAWLFSSIPLSIHAQEGGVTFWHWPMVVGGIVASIGLRIRRPFWETSGIVLMLSTLTAYEVVLGGAAWTDAPWYDPHDFLAGLMVFLGLLAYILVCHVIDVWTFPRSHKVGRRWWHP